MIHTNTYKENFLYIKYILFPLNIRIKVVDGQNRRLGVRIRPSDSRGRRRKYFYLQQKMTHLLQFCRAHHCYSWKLSAGLIVFHYLQNMQKKIYGIQKIYQILLGLLRPPKFCNWLNALTKTG